MPTKLGHYAADKGKDKPTRGDKGDLPAGSGRQLNIDTLDRDAKTNGSAKLPRDAK